MINYINKFIKTYFHNFEFDCTFVLLSSNGLNKPSMKRTLLLLALVMSSVFGYSQTAPNAPTGVTAAQINLENKALIEWVAPTSGATPDGYKVYYNVKGSTVIDSTVKLTTLNATLSNLKLDTVYNVRVRAFKALTVPKVDTAYSPFSTTVNVLIARQLAKPNFAIETAYTTFDEIVLRLLDTNKYATHFMVKVEGDGPAVEHEVLKTGPETVFKLTALKAKTQYMISVKSLRKSGTTVKDQSAYTDIKYETTKVAPPPAAINFKTEQDCPYGVAFTWDYASGQEDITYVVVQASTITDPWNFTNIGNVNANEKFFFWSGAEPGMVYNYRIETQNSTANRLSGVHTIATKNWTEPNNPVNIKTIYKTPNEITFKWDLGVQDNTCKTNIIANTEVQISINGSPRQHVADLPPYAPQEYSIKNLQPGSIVEIFLRAHSDKQLYPSGYSSAKDTTYGPPQRPANIYGGVFADNFKNNYVEIWWDDVKDEGQYYIERSLDGTNYTLLAFVKENVVRFKDVRVDEGVSYYYRVKAENWVGASGYSVVGPFTIGFTSAPSAPYGLTAKKQGNSVVLTWVDDTHKEEKYFVEKSTDGGNEYIVIGELGKDVETYTDNNISEGKTYFYRVRAWNRAFQYSNYSLPAKIIIPAAASGFVFDATVFPNPISESISIKAENADVKSKYTLKIYNQTNILVLEKEINFSDGPTVQIKVPNLAPGSYNLTLSDSKEKVSKKIIKL